MSDKNFDPQSAASFFLKAWEDSSLFKAGQKTEATPYTIMMPPANVTGNLHLGHALTFTLQDILIRYHRMQGRDVLWQPGTDHAGIATQMVVERQLEKEGSSRQQLGREKFLERVWAWKEESGGAIIHQLKQLGASADWTRERFTMDPHFDSCVKKVFVTLYKSGLIYRDKRLVNWDAQYQTAISDLEVEQQERKDQFYYIKYPIENSEQFIVVATTRPETFFGDVAVAVHPEDERYQHLIGKNVILPLISRPIPIIGDTQTDSEKGTGAVKITPAHDFHDFEVAKRHHLPLLSILDSYTRLNSNVPAEYQGLSVQEARRKVVEYLELQGLVEKIEEITHMVPHGDRSGIIIEPMLTDQWYVDAKTLAIPAIEAVEEGKTRFIPKRWEKTYFEWLQNIQPWCISRQLWWGHQIPAWYGPDEKIFVAETEAEAKEEAEKYYGYKVSLRQEVDVLDTWFSSALWPFVTLDWPEDHPFLRRHYPGDVLVTGFDIIFFWVARMMMMGLYFKKEVPFKDVYIHALIRDAKGQKMSKSKGNIIDPLKLIESYGADVLRFCLASLAAPGKDIKISEDRVAGMRNFSTKLWNASRYLLLNGCNASILLDPQLSKLTVNQWIIQEMGTLARESAHLIETYRFHEAAQRLYQFIWGTFCDWYVEFTKPLLASPDTAVVIETKGCLSWCLSQLVHLLHPFMPFITEEIWKAFGGKDLLAGRPFPILEGYTFPSSHQAIESVVETISEIRALRAELNVPVAQKLSISCYEVLDKSKKYLEENKAIILRLARLDSMTLSSGKPNFELPEGTVQLVLNHMTLVISLKGIIDIEQEKQRLTKEIQKMDLDLQSIQNRLEKPDFRAKAPEHIIEELEERMQGLCAKKEKISRSLKCL